LKLKLKLNLAVDEEVRRIWGDLLVGREEVKNDAVT
jgi:hypothetical protein